MGRRNLMPILSNELMSMDSNHRVLQKMEIDPSL